ncbi:MAG: hypothetical protein ACYDGR_13745 [Candidatus Dormibacteria bacterium]
MPFPQVPVSVDIAAAVVVAFGGYFGQEALIKRKKLRATGFGLRTERRHRERATEVAGTTPERQAADLALAIDAMIEFIDGPARARQTKACAAKVASLVPPERRGPLTLRFLQMVEERATPSSCQQLAEDVCVQMAVELRAINARTRPLPSRHHAPTAEAAQPATIELAPKPSRPSRPSAARPAWARAEEEIQELGQAQPTPTPTNRPRRTASTASTPRPRRPRAKKPGP